LVVRKAQEERNQGNSWWKEKGGKEETRGTIRGTVDGKKMTGRTESWEQLVARRRVRKESG
jgi:hypothetical protein